MVARIGVFDGPAVRSNRVEHGIDIGGGRKPAWLSGDCPH
jgi:hypothetical protein